MASDCNKEPLLSELINPPNQDAQKDNRVKRRLRRCRSAPSVNEISESTIVNVSFPGYKYVFNLIHPSLRKIALILIAYLGVGTLCFLMVMGQIKGAKTDGILDALYFCMVTMTTVGYGDLVPDSVPAKLLACAFVFTGMAVVGLVLSRGADYFIEKQRVLLFNALHTQKNAHEIENSRQIDSRKLKYKFIVTTLFLLLMIVIGTVFLTTFEKLNLVDAFYCVCSTISTLGYGDKSFSTKEGRVFAVFWILVSTICLAQFFLYLAEYHTEQKQHMLASWVLNRRMTVSDLEAADLDYDRSVVAAEFVLYKLKEMGKINQEDIAQLLQHFENLDVDQSGTLTPTDLALAQSSR